MARNDLMALVLQEFDTTLAGRDAAGIQEIVDAVQEQLGSKADSGDIRSALLGLLSRSELVLTPDFKLKRGEPVIA